MMNKKDFAKVVRNYRVRLPYYNNGRRVVVLSEYSAKGQSIIDTASHYEGETLSDIYTKCSPEKHRAYDEVWEMYCNDNDASCFGICSHNYNMFTVSWLSKNMLIYLTNVTEYVVILNE